jgi:ubiquinone/menaquinone biosynthesis C-methylase UbiE
LEEDDVSFMEKLVRQCRKPTGRMAKFVGMGMNIGHGRLRRWGLTHVAVEPDASILDVGCGGGRAVHVLAQMAPGGQVYGIDYSRDMVQLAQKVNRALIEAGRVKVRHGSVSSLPFPDGMFDLVTAFEAYYFWPHLIDDLKEIKRVLRSGGTLLIANEAYEHKRFAERNARWVQWGDMKIHTPDEYRAFLTEAGYAVAEIDVLPEKNWIAAVARKQ